MEEPYQVVEDSVESGEGPITVPRQGDPGPEPVPVEAHPAPLVGVTVPVPHHEVEQARPEELRLVDRAGALALQSWKERVRGDDLPGSRDVRSLPVGWIPPFQDAEHSAELVPP